MQKVKHVAGLTMVAPSTFYIKEISLSIINNNLIFQSFVELLQCHCSIFSVSRDTQLMQ